jgi:hypothetical protein
VEITKVAGQANLAVAACPAEAEAVVDEKKQIFFLMRSSHVSIDT